MEDVLKPFNQRIAEKKNSRTDETVQNFGRQFKEDHGEGQKNWAAPAAHLTPKEKF